MPAPLVGVVLFPNILRNFLPQFPALREPPTERGDERLVALAGLRARRGLGGLGPRWARRKPEADEYGQRFDGDARSEEHTSELQSLMSSPSAVFCLQKQKSTNENQP